MQTFILGGVIHDLVFLLLDPYGSANSFLFFLFTHSQQKTLMSSFLLVLCSSRLSSLVPRLHLSLQTFVETKLMERKKEGDPQKCYTVTFCQGISVLSPSHWLGPA